jgi:hypothetical protein
MVEILDKHNVIDKESGGGKGNTTSGAENRKRGRGRPRRIDQTHPVTKIVVDQFSTEYMTKRDKLARGADKGSSIEGHTMVALGRNNCIAAVSIAGLMQ